MKKLFFINFTFFFLLLIAIFLLLKFINLFFSGPPRYYEIVYNFDTGSLREKKEKLVFYKSQKNLVQKNDFIKFYSHEYKSLDYSGPIKNEDCGSFESGKYELIYALDKNGFRENKDELYEKTDYVLLGDSFTMSVCENKPNDLKSQIQSLEKSKTFLNLGVGADNYVRQLATLTEITKNTDFNSLIWFFYEGNDYNDDIDKLEFYRKNINPNHNERKKNIKQLGENFDYYKISNSFDISYYYKFRVWLAEELNGLSTLLKIFKKYETLLNEEEYYEATKIAKVYLDKKNVKRRYIYYIPSWQRLSNHKSLDAVFFSRNPQIDQLNNLKRSVKNISEKNGFIFIDGENKLLNLESPLEIFHYKLNTHFNKDGYKLLAEDVYNNIINE